MLPQLFLIYTTADTTRLLNENWAYHRLSNLKVNAWSKMGSCRMRRRSIPKLSWVGPVWRWVEPIHTKWITFDIQIVALPPTHVQKGSICKMQKHVPNPKGNLYKNLNYWSHAHLFLFSLPLASSMWVHNSHSNPPQVLLRLGIAPFMGDPKTPPFLVFSNPHRCFRCGTYAPT